MSLGGFKPSFENLWRRLSRRTSWLGHSKTSNASLHPGLQGNDSSTDLGYLEPCYILWKNQIPVVVWLETLLEIYRSNTVVGDVHLLVQDVQEAAVILHAARYEETSSRPRFEHEPEFAERSLRLAHPSSELGVVLLPAQDWYYDLSQAVEHFLPPLNLFLDAMFDFWLNISSQDYVNRLRFALYIGCLINDCYKVTTLEGPPVKDPAYAMNLRLVHREIHYDIVSTDPKAESFTITRRHEYHVRRSKEIAEGIFSPQPYKIGMFRSDLTAVAE